MWIAVAALMSRRNAYKEHAELEFLYFFLTESSKSRVSNEQTNSSPHLLKFQTLNFPKLVAFIIWRRTSSIPILQMYKYHHHYFLYRLPAHHCPHQAPACLRNTYVTSLRNQILEHTKEIKEILTMFALSKVFRQI